MKGEDSGCHGRPFEAVGKWPVGVFTDYRSLAGPKGSSGGKYFDRALGPGADWRGSAVSAPVGSPSGVVGRTRASRASYSGVARRALGLLGVARQALALPVHVVATEPVEVRAVEYAGEHEQQVAQAVEVVARLGAHRAG